MLHVHVSSLTTNSLFTDQRTQAKAEGEREIESEKGMDLQQSKQKQYLKKIALLAPSSFLWHSL